MEPMILRGEVPSGYGSGSGSDYGDGSGYGSGYGYGDGSGYGSGYGYGSGSGDGSGYGYGDGYGDGYGSGDGSGYGYGDGSGDGYGSGYGEYWLSTIPYFADKWLPEQRQHLMDHHNAGTKIAFWLSDERGLPSNGGGLIEPAAPGVVHSSAGPLNLCKAGTLHATLLPTRWNGDRWWIVALIGDVIGDDKKYGALRREIIGECL